MRNNSVIIATNALFLADILKDKLMGNGLQVFTATSDNDLSENMKTLHCKFIFMEHCFHGNGTDVFVHRMAKGSRFMRIVIWAACEVKPIVAARYIEAGAESFISLRDSGSNIEKIMKQVVWGQHYCPADVEAVLDKTSVNHFVDGQLTKREIEILKLSASGKTNEQIGQVLGLSVNTVKTHKRKLYCKCGGNSIIDILHSDIAKKYLQ
jgi:DNA-binding NarL/FixJ family response regulator